MIPADTRPGRLLPFVCRMLPEIPEYAIREAFRKRDVKLNGQRVGMDAVILPGAEVQIYTRDLESKAVEVPVIYEDQNVLVVFKPSGVSCEADSKGGKTLPQLLHTQMLEKDPSAAEPLLCHRLDNPTEGLILLAKTERVQQLLQDAFRNHQVHKTYTCIVKETPEPETRILSDYLIKDAQNARVEVSGHKVPGSKRIVTEYTVAVPGECAVLTVRLHTGRTHQIRAHMAFIGHPLLGDDQYGDREFNKIHRVRKLMLCSTELAFSLKGEMAYLNQRTFRCQPSFVREFE